MKRLGVAYRVDLTSVANAANVLADMRFDTASFVIAPALAVGRDSGSTVAARSGENGYLLSAAW
ncbi:MAG TPA: hypothetical protein VL284_17715 [Thermoanaerobaculia bacterium]|nr:hypothetical protein [Thermoanaerobaculia bacterium]